MEWQDRFTHGSQCQLKQKDLALARRDVVFTLRLMIQHHPHLIGWKSDVSCNTLWNTCKWTCVPYPPPPYTRIVAVAVRQIESSSKQLDTSSEDEAVLSSSPPSSIYGGRITFPRYLVQWNLPTNIIFSGPFLSGSDLMVQIIYGNKSTILYDVFYLKKSAQHFYLWGK